MTDNTQDLIEKLTIRVGVLHKTTPCEAITARLVVDMILPTIQQELQSLIRTEKLKLLGEVRERVVGRNQSLPKRGDIDPDIYVEVIHRVEGRNALRAEQLSKLTQLEAGL